MKIAIGAIMQETNSFSSIKTDIDDFKYSSLQPLLEGPDLIKEHKGRKTEIGGFIKACEENNIEIIPTISTFAVPSGNVTQRAFRWLKATLLEKLEQVKELDGVLLALHGSMAVDGVDDGEGEILAEVRKLIGEKVYLGCTLDLHANVTKRMIKNADLLIGYETHEDYQEIGMKAVRKLLYCIRNNIKTKISLIKIPVVLGAGRRILETKRRMEKEKGVLTISVFDDQPWLDVEEYGPSVIVITENKEELGEKLCKELARELWEVRNKERADLVSIAEALEEVKHSEGKPIILIECGDMTGTGASGDSVAVLDALLKNGIRSIATIVYDPLAVSRAFEAGLENEIEVDIGGKCKYEGSFPLKFKGTVRSLYDGKYTLKGIPFEGINAFLGKTAVIGSDDIDIILTSKIVYPQGRAIFDALKMDVSGKKVITLKSFNGFGFPVNKVINVDTPGWANWHFSTVPYKKIKRPIYPLDDFDFDQASMNVITL